MPDKPKNKRLSDAMKKYYASNPHPRTGKKHSEETKKRWSVIRKGVKQPEDFARRRIESIRKFWASKQSLKARLIRSQQKKHWFSAGGGKQLRGRACRAHYLKHPILQEELIKEQLVKRGVAFESQTVFGGRYVVDIYLPNEDKVIECDSTFRRKRFAIRDAELLKHVKSVVHILYREIKVDVSAATERALNA